MKKKYLPLVAILAFSFSASASESLVVNEKAQVNLLEQKITQMQIRQEQAELRGIRIDWALAPIKSTQGLIELAEKASPLDALSEMARQTFIESVVFGEKGVGSYDYEVLERELTVTQAYKVLSLIGAQYTLSYLTGLKIETKLDEMLISSKQAQALPGGFKGYKCESPGTCGIALTKICTSNC